MRGTVRQLGRLAAGAAFALAWSQSTLTAFATDVSVTLQGTSGSGKPMDMLDIMFLFLFLAIVPSLVIMMTSFTRIIIHHCTVIPEKCPGHPAVPAQPDPGGLGSVPHSVYHESGAFLGEYPGLSAL